MESTEKVQLSVIIPTHNQRVSNMSHVMFPVNLHVMTFRIQQIGIIGSHDIVTVENLTDLLKIDSDISPKAVWEELYSRRK